MNKFPLILLILASLTASGQSPVAINVDANANHRHPINPLIYGINYGAATTLADLNAPLHRLGGNNTSRYNWLYNAGNKDADWYFESIGDANAAQGERGDTFISVSKAAGAEPMLTIPMIGWIAKLGANRSKLASFSIGKYGAQTGHDPWFPDAGNGIKPDGAFVTGNDPTDANTIDNSAVQNAWVDHVVMKWGGGAHGGLRYYILDNEHSLWWSTHRDVQPIGPHAFAIGSWTFRLSSRPAIPRRSWSDPKNGDGVDFN